MCVSVRARVRAHVCLCTPACVRTERVGALRLSADGSCGWLSRVLRALGAVPGLSKSQFNVKYRQKGQLLAREAVL